MNIAINTRLLRENYITGVQNYITNLMQYLPEVRTDDKYHWLKPKGNYHTPLGRAIFDSYLVKKQIAQQNIHVYHSPHGPLPIGKKGCNYISTVHDLGFKVLPEYGRKIDLLYLKMVTQNILNKSDIVVTDSNSVKEELCHFYNISDKTIKVIPPGIDPYYFTKESNEYLNRVRRKYGLNGYKVVYSNSAHSPRKNINALIDVFNKYYPDYTHTKLLISGSINQIYPVSNNISVLPYVSKRVVRAFYQIADVFVYPSFYEGFGFPVLEAMASRCLVAYSNIPSLNEINLNKNYAFNPHDKSEIHQVVRHALGLNQTVKNQHIEDCCRLSQKYDWITTTKMLSKLYHS